MKKLTKLGIVALFTLFLSACDQVAQKNTSTQNQNMAINVEQAKTDYQKLINWKVGQEDYFNQFQNELQQFINAKDQAKIEQAMAGFQQKSNQFLAQLNSIEVKTPEVNTLKAKAADNFVILNELLIVAVNAVLNRTQEALAAIQQKQQELATSTAEIEKLQLQLENKLK